MRYKKLFLFLIAYFIITMAWAYPWHILWFHEKYVTWGAMTRENPIIPLGMLAIIIQGLVIGYLYPFYYKREKNPLLQGVTFNLLIGLMTYTAMGFATAAKFDINPVSSFLLFHTVFQALQFTFTGLALGWIYAEKR